MFAISGAAVLRHHPIEGARLHEIVVLRVPRALLRPVTPESARPWS